MGDGELTADAARLELYEVMNSEADFDEKVERALEIGQRYLEVENGHVTRIDAGTDYWEAIASTDSQGGEFGPGTVLDLQRTYCRRTVAEDGPVALHDAPRQGWADDPAFQEHGLHCYHGSTITADDEVYGTVCFVSREPRSTPFTESETTFAELVARLIEHELERQRHEAELLRRSNLITVLDRILRHNLRNDLSVVRGYVSRLASTLDEDDGTGEVVVEAVDSLIDLSEKARELESIVSSELQSRETSATSLAQTVVSRVRTEYPSASITVDGTGDDAVTVLSSAEVALRELVENAAKHAGPDASVVVDVGTDQDSVRFEVRDDGPGLPSQERAVLREGAETSLVHGSGLGLWLVYWIVTSHEGTVDATVDDSGTTVTMTLPRVAPDVEPIGERSDQRTLQWARDKFGAVFEDSFDAMVITDDEGRYVEVNQAAADLFGASRRELLGRSVAEFVDDDVDVEAAWEQFLQAGETRGTIPIRRADGTERIAEYAATADVVPGQHLSILRDVTERERRQRDLERYEAVLETIEDVAFLVDRDRKLTYVNRRGTEITGTARDDLVGRPLADLVDRFVRDPDQRARYREAIEEILAGERERARVELSLAADPLGEFVADVRLTQFAPDDEIEGVVGIVRNVTERVQRERALRETSERLEGVVEASPNPIVVVDDEGRIDRWNAAAEDVYGWTEPAVLGERPPMIRDGERATFRERLEDVLDGRQYTDLSVRHRRKDGSEVSATVSTAPLRDVDGEVDGVVAVVDAVASGEDR